MSRNPIHDPPPVPIGSVHGNATPKDIEQQARAQGCFLSEEVQGLRRELEGAKRNLAETERARADFYQETRNAEARVEELEGANRILREKLMEADKRVKALTKEALQLDGRADAFRVALESLHSTLLSELREARSEPASDLGPF